jgi:hypothetical protein
MSTTSKKIIMWIISAFLLVALADYFPRIAVGFTGLLVIDVLLINSDKYVALLKNING